jgi:hypothetical protein
MLGKFAMAAAFVLAASAPALAADCSQPIPPEMTVDGTTATAQQMNDAIHDFKNYQAASDDYQNCLYADLDAQKKAAAKEKDPKPLDPSIESGINAKVAANQAEKEKLGGQLNAQIKAFQNAHPKK